MPEPESVAAQPLERDLQLHLGPLTLDPHKIIYATIILMTSFAIYDEGTEQLSTGAYVEIIALSIAPLFALAMAHAFSEALDLQIRNGRRLSGADRRHLFLTNLQYLYVAIPPLLLIVLLSFLQWPANDIVGVAMLMGIASLFFWGIYAGRKAGMSRIRQLSFGLNYGLMGLFVITVELIITH